MIEPASVSVLVAEDDPRLAEVLSATLIASGYGVTVAHSGDDALSLLSSQRVDLLITDINMPGN